MNIFGKKVRKLPANPVKNSPVEITVNITVKAKPDRYEERNIAELKVEKNLLSTTDTKMKDIREEIDGILQGVYQDLSDRIEVSPDLTDGYWKEKEDEKIV